MYLGCSHGSVTTLQEARLAKSGPCDYLMQVVAVTGLLVSLNQRMQLSFAARQALSRAAEFLEPTGETWTAKFCYDTK